MATTYVITKNVNESHTTFTSNTGDIITVPNEEAGVMYAPAIDNNNIRITVEGKAKIIAPFTAFSGVGIVTTTATTFIDTLHQFYFIKPAGGGGGIPSKIQNTAGTTYVETPLADDCIVMQSEDPVSNVGTFITQTTTSKKIKIMGPMVTEANTGLVPTLTPYEFGRVKASLVPADGTRFFVKVQMYGQADSAPPDASGPMLRHYMGQGNGTVLTAASYAASTTPLQFGYIELVSATNPDALVAGPIDGAQPAGFYTSVTPLEIKTRKDGAGDLVFEAPLFGAKAYTTGNVSFCLELTVYFV